MGERPIVVLIDGQALFSIRLENEAKAGIVEVKGQIFRKTIYRQRSLAMDQHTFAADVRIGPIEKGVVFLQFPAYP